MYFNMDRFSWWGWRKRKASTPDNIAYVKDLGVDSHHIKTRLPTVLPGPNYITTQVVTWVRWPIDNRPR